MLERDMMTSEATARGSERTITCRAEVVDCNCPESCERDHGND
jgi:hypothetical protein